MKKGVTGNHNTAYAGRGDEQTSDRRPYQFGDQVNQIDFTASIRNSQLRSGIDNFNLSEKDLEVIDNQHKAR